MAIIDLDPAAWYRADRGVNEDRSSDYTDDYVFNAPLKSSLILDRGTGSPTFTRASVATVVDHEGLIKTVKAGEARFTGARRIENLLTYSQDLSNAAWTKYRAPVMTYNAGAAPDGTTTADFIAPTAVGGTNAGVYQTVTLTAGLSHVFSFYIKASGWTWAHVNKLGDGSSGVWFNIATGVVGTQSSGCVGYITSVGSGWYRCSVLANSGGTTYCEVGLVDADNSLVSSGNSVNGAYVWGTQLEMVRGQSNQLASEYVSTNVLSFPYNQTLTINGVAHETSATGVDGVAYSRYTNGSTVSGNTVTEAAGSPIADATLKGYLAEGSRQNICLQSEDFSTTWNTDGGANAGISTDASVSPSGTTIADKLYEKATTAGHYVRQTIAKAGSGIQYTFSCYAKQAERTWASFHFDGGTVNAGVRFWFDLGTGVVGSTNNSGYTAPFTTLSSSIEPAANGFYRCKMVFTTDANLFLRMFVMPSNADASFSYAGTLNSGIYIWGAQLELGSFASSYIPTTTAAVTRNSDVLTYPTSGNVSGTAGTCYAEVAGENVPTSGRLVALGTGVPLYRDAGGDIGIYDGANESSNSAFTPSSSIQKCASAWGGSTMGTCVGGTLGGSVAFDGDLVTGATVYIGSNPTTTENLFGSIRNVRIWTSAVPQYVLQTLTGGTPPSSALTAQWVNDQSGNERVLEQSTAASRPILLDYDGTPYAYLSGVAGNYFSTPDSVAASITGDIDIRVKVALDDWTPAAANTLVAKYSAVGNLSYLAYVDTTGVLGFVFTSDGSTVIVAQSSSAAPVVSDGSTLWVRVTRASASGNVNYYTSADGSSWTQLGSADRISTAGALFDGNAPVELGTNLAGTTQPLLGKIYRAQIYDGIDGTLAVDFNPADFTETSTNGATAVSSGTGETWTLNSTGAKPAQVVKSASLLFDGANDYMKTAAFTLNQPETVYLVAKQVSWTSGDYICDGNANDGGVLYQTVGTPKVAAYAGTSLPESAGNLAVGSFGIIAAVFNGASSVLQINATTAVTGAAGAANLGGFTLASNGLGANFWSNIQVKEVLIFSAAHDAATRALVIDELIQRWAVSRQGGGDGTRFSGTLDSNGRVRVVQSTYGGETCRAAVSYGPDFLYADVSTGAPDHFVNGMPFTAGGALALSTAAIDHHFNGLPFTADSRISVEALDMDYMDQGVPFTSNGKVAIIVVSPL